MRTYHVISRDGKRSYQHPFTNLQYAQAFAKACANTFKEQKFAIHIGGSFKGDACCFDLIDFSALQALPFCIVHQDLAPQIEDERKGLFELFNPLNPDRNLPPNFNDE